MKRKIRVLSLLCMMVILSGCMKLNVDCGIKKDHSAYLTYTIELDMKELSNDLKREVVSYFKEFTNRYEEYGFTSVTKNTDDTIDIVLTYQKSASNYEEAYENLKTMLNNPKISFLMSTDMTTVAEEYEQGFTFNADIDVSKIIETSYLNTLPYNINNMISAGIAKSEINFSLSLPQSTIVETNGDIQNVSGTTKIVFPVSLTEESSFHLIARMSIDNNKAVNGDINSLTVKNKQIISLYKTLIIVAATLVVVVSIGFVYLTIKQKKDKQKKA